MLQINKNTDDEAWTRIESHLYLHIRKKRGMTTKFSTIISHTRDDPECLFSFPFLDRRIRFRSSYHCTFCNNISLLVTILIHEFRIYKKKGDVKDQFRLAFAYGQRGSLELCILFNEDILNHSSATQSINIANYSYDYDFLYATSLHSFPDNKQISIQQREYFLHSMK